MPQSKCTCKRRNALAHVRNRLYPHDEGCYYTKVLEEADQARKNREDADRLYKAYRGKLV